jgi:hypothetical protein
MWRKSDDEENSNFFSGDPGGVFASVHGARKDEHDAGTQNHRRLHRRLIDLNFCRQRQITAVVNCLAKIAIMLIM